MLTPIVPRPPRTVLSPAPSAGRESHRDPPPEIGKGDSSQLQRRDRRQRRGHGRKAGAETVEVTAQMARTSSETAPVMDRTDAAATAAGTAATGTPAATKKNGHRQLSGPW